MPARFSLVAMLCVAFTAMVVQSQMISVFDQPNGRGNAFFVPIKRCVNLNFWGGRAQSVHTHNSCVRLFTEKSCKGKSVFVLPGSAGHSNLDEIGFSKKAYSVGACQAAGHQPSKGNSEAKEPTNNGNSEAKEPTNNGNSEAKEPTNNGNNEAKEPTNNGNSEAKEPTNNGNSHAKKTGKHRKQ